MYFVCLLFLCSTAFYRLVSSPSTHHCYKCMCKMNWVQSDDRLCFQFNRSRIYWKKAKKTSKNNKRNIAQKYSSSVCETKIKINRKRRHARTAYKAIFCTFEHDTTDRLFHVKYIQWIDESSTFTVMGQFVIDYCMFLFAVLLLFYYILSFWCVFLWSFILRLYFNTFSHCLDQFLPTYMVRLSIYFHTNQNNEKKTEQTFDKFASNFEINDSINA